MKTLSLIFWSINIFQSLFGLMFRIVSFTIITIFILSGCAPTIYMMDRHTIMEEEASGKWPDLENELLLRAKKKGPTILQKEKGKTSSYERSQKILHGELNSEILERELK